MLVEGVDCLGGVSLFVVVSYYEGRAASVHAFGFLS